MRVLLADDFPVCHEGVSKKLTDSVIHFRILSHLLPYLQILEYPLRPRISGFPLKIFPCVVFNKH